MSTNAKVTTALLLAAMCSSPVTLAQFRHLDIPGSQIHAQPVTAAQEAAQRRAETAALEAQTRLLEAQTRQLELGAQAQQLELERQRQLQSQASRTSEQTYRTTERDVASEAAISLPTNVPVQRRIKNAQNASRQAMHAERVTKCMERGISEQYCLSIASNELAVAFDGYIRAEPYRSRQMRDVEANIAR